MKDNRLKPLAVQAPLRLAPAPEERLRMPEPRLSALALVCNYTMVRGRAAALLPAVFLEQVKGFGTLDR